MTWWLWVIIIVGVLVVGFFIFAVIGAIAISSRISIAEEEKSDNFK